LLRFCKISLTEKIKETPYARRGIWRFFLITNKDIASAANSDITVNLPQMPIFTYTEISTDKISYRTNTYHYQIQLRIKTSQSELFV